jgi:hypothetical protein
MVEEVGGVSGINVLAPTAPLYYPTDTGRVRIFKIYKLQITVCSFLFKDARLERRVIIGGSAFGRAPPPANDAPPKGLKVNNFEF